VKFFEGAGNNLTKKRLHLELHETVFHEVTELACNLNVSFWGAEIAAASCSGLEL